LTDLQQLGDALKVKLGAQRQIRTQAEEAEETAVRQKEQAARLDQVVALLAALQETWRNSFQEAVGRLVSQGLAGVFGEELDLVVEMGMSGDLPTARFAVRDGRGLETDVMDARGGGLVNVASFLLRVLLLLSARPPLARLLVLDESFSNVSAEYLPTLTALLRRICEEGNFEILLVTHRPELADAADVAYEFKLVDGVTEVRRIKKPEDERAEAGV
jgi:DNA repair exonuclease SbcCD ATPase subunit